MRYADRRALVAAIAAKHHRVKKMERALDRELEELRQLERRLASDAYYQPNGQEQVSETCQAQDQSACA
jgi:hypothetical protein